MAKEETKTETSNFENDSLESLQTTLKVLMRKYPGQRTPIMGEIFDAIQKKSGTVEPDDSKKKSEVTDKVQKAFEILDSEDLIEKARGQVKQVGELDLSRKNVKTANGWVPVKGNEHLVKEHTGGEHHTEGIKVLANQLKTGDYVKHNVAINSNKSKTQYGKVIGEIDNNAKMHSGFKKILWDNAVGDEHGNMKNLHYEHHPDEGGFEKISREQYLKEAKFTNTKGSYLQNAGKHEDFDAAQKYKQPATQIVPETFKNPNTNLTADDWFKKYKIEDKAAYGLARKKRME